MGGGERGEYNDEKFMLISNSDRGEDGDGGEDLEDQGITSTPNSLSKGGRGGAIKDLFLKHLDRSFPARCLSSFKRLEKDTSRDLSPRPHSHNHNRNRDDFGGHHDDDVLGDSAPPEWVLLLLGCLLGLASGLCVAAFNTGVSPSSS